MQPDDVILELRQVGKTYPGVTALAGVDFTLRRGEVHVLLGENGAGKSTLAKILSGACRRSTGELRLFGNEVDLRTPRQAQALGVGMIYQEFNLVPQLTVAQNIFLGREPGRWRGLVDDAGLNRRAEAVLKTLGAPVSVTTPVGQLGVAQQQMVEIAKALSLEARILIMDEPTSALTATEIRELFRAIGRLKAAGVSIIYISHRMEELLEIGDRVTVLRDGRSVATRNLRETTVDELVRLMVAREVSEHYPRRRGEPGDELLRVEGLCQDERLRDISFSLHRGEVLGVAGLLGSGRTRLARTLFGAEPATAGRIWIKGQRCDVRSPRHAIARGLGWVTEDRRRQGLVLSMSVAANTTLASLSRFCTGGTIRRRRERQAAGDFAGQLRVKSAGLDQRTLQLSGGNQQKVVVGKWLCSRADVFIFDEPTRGIDIGAKVEIYQLMNQLTERGAAILLISSDLPELLGMSDRLVVMCRGRITGSFAAAGTTPESVLEKALGLPA